MMRVHSIKVLARKASAAVQGLQVGTLARILMSFKPLYAEQILSRRKDCEIRTFFGPIESGDEVLVYESSPVKAFTGVFRVEGAVVARASEAIEFVRSSCSMFDEENWRFVEEHYVGSRRRLVVIVIDLESVRRLRKPVTLEEIRSIVPAFRPPMSYSRISDELYEAVLELGEGLEPPML